MNSIPYIDLYTLTERKGRDTVTVRGIFPGDPIPAFSGRNFYCIGLSPSSLKERDKNNELLMITEEALELDHVIFVGSCGTNKNAATGIEEQLRVFEAQAIMAEENQKPLLISSSGNYRDIIEIHNNILPAQPWIIHGYTGNAEDTALFRGRNFLFSFGEELLSEESDLQSVFSSIPSEKIFFETGRFDKELNILYKKGAEIKNISPEEMKITVRDNFNRLENVSFSDLA